MSMQVMSSNEPMRERARSERLEYRVIYLASFMVFLPAVVAKRCLFRRRDAAERRSILKETAAAAHTVVPFAFMG
jgi:hypothetical protein